MATNTEDHNFTKLWGEGPVNFLISMLASNREIFKGFNSEALPNEFKSLVCVVKM